MDQLSITTLAYSSASIASALLTIIFCLQWYQNRIQGWFALATALNTLWLMATSMAYIDESFPRETLLSIESLHYSGWVLALNRALFSTSSKSLPAIQNILLWSVFGFSLLTIVDLITPIITSPRPLFLLLLVQSIICLLALEQLYRNTDGNRYLKLLCLNLGLYFFYDVMANTHSLIFEYRSPNVVQARAAIALATCLLIAVSALVFHRTWFQSSPAKLSISRPTAFYTSSLLVSGLFISFASLGAYFISRYGGNWGVVAFTLFVFLSIILMSMILFSRTFRLRLAVLINKHLFQHKYDYREEWLKFIGRLSYPIDNKSVLQTAFSALAAIFQAPGGAVWMRRGYSYTPLYRAGLDEQIELPREPADSDFCETLQNQGWVFMPKAETREMQQNNEYLPEWVVNFPDVWLVLPLLTGDNNELSGFIILTSPTHDDTLTWEDLDLLKLVGKELANYVKRHEQSQQLAENLQFDAYNKLTAFIMHDLNNVIAQQSLVVSNAGKHKDNPEFVEDAIHTISNSITRMENLLHRLKRTESQTVELLSVSEVINNAIANCDSGHPQPTFTSLSADPYIKADKDRIELAITHLLKNAQEATSDTGHIDVVLNREDKVAVIIISDNGCGMAPDFIEDRLFKPFQTTKSGKGMGIGVYLTRSYINQLGGTLDVSSRPNVGTTFTIRLQTVEP